MQELYGWSMDAIVKEIGLKNNCMLLFLMLFYIKITTLNCLHQEHCCFDLDLFAV